MLYCFDVSWRMSSGGGRKRIRIGIEETQIEEEALWKTRMSIDPFVPLKEDFSIPETPEQLDSESTNRLSASDWLSLLHP